MKIGIVRMNSGSMYLEYAGHARDFVRGLDLNEWNGIVVASGDGLVYEVNNFRKQYLR